MDPIEVIDAVTENGIHLPSRSIFVFGTINDETALRLAGQLEAIRPMTPGGITVCINSEGGEESAGFAMYDLLRSCSSSVTTVGIGSVMSIAALVFQAGDFRKLTPECRMMVHNGSYDFGKGAQQQNHVIDYAKEMKAVNRRYATLIAERAGIKPSKVMGWCRGDKYFSATEAVQNGLADAIVTYPSKRKLP